MTDKQTLAPTITIWNGPYQTWFEALRAAQSHKIDQPIFTSERWLQQITNQLLDYRNELKKYAIAQPPRPCNLPWIVGLLSPSSIIDFGGSSGWVMDYLQNTIPENTISSYSIIEIESVVKHMQISELQANIIKYQTLDEPLNHCDLLYSNSALQYIESNALFLSLIERTTPNYIFLEDLVAKGEKDFFGTQSYGDKAIPYRFIGLDNLINDLSSVGYRKLVRSPYMCPVLGVMKPLPMENFPENFRLQYSSSILLKRTQY